MKVIFLDIDGVLNSIRWFDNLYDTNSSLAYPQSDFDPECVERLNRICDATGAKLVITSDRRVSELIREVLPVVGVAGEIIGQTLVLFNATRGVEIAEWLKGHPEVKQYAIVDDRTDFLQDQLKHFVNTSDEVGLTDDNASKLIEILNSEEDDKD